MDGELIESTTGFTEGPERTANWSQGMHGGVENLWDVGRIQWQWILRGAKLVGIEKAAVNVVVNQEPVSFGDFRGW